ncbi:LAGLIDADG family homing endonuclease [Candidatus Woesearchaeota archaeon]|nr:LAGLIDADG family homing endonuclease [Candidatus Woesearchaeota archaeon]
MDQLYVLGLCEGEGSFVISILKSKHYSRRTNNLRAKLIFCLTLHEKDRFLLKKLRIFFNCGYICNAREEARFSVERMNDINEKIIQFFNRNCLIGKKRRDYTLWKKAVKIFNAGEHRTIEGIKCLERIRNNMNLQRANRRINRFI